jgi:hypothetical protein
VSREAILMLIVAELYGVSIYMRKNAMARLLSPLALSNRCVA